MASYPGAVKTFTTKSDGAGNKIFAAHINDLQDEVTAIEDGLLNGTAPVNSSRITAASLSVAGASTFVGAVSLPAVEAAILQIGAAQQIADNTTSAISWTAQVSVTNSSMHSTATNPTRVHPQSTGVFLCEASIGWNAARSTVYSIQIEDSSGTVLAQAVRRAASSGPADNFTQTITGLKYVPDVSGVPYFRVIVTATASTNTVDAQPRTHFSVVKLR